MPMMPNEQSIKRQPSGIPRTPPAINASGMTSTQAIAAKLNSPKYF